jgi:peptide subunit release factor 1 (eRF1)
MMKIEQHRLRREHMARFLDDLEAQRRANASIYLPAGAQALHHVPEEVINRISRSKTGAALFLGEGLACAVIPPFPLPRSETFSGVSTAPLRALLERDRLIALIVVRLGDYGIGIFEGERRIGGKVGTGLVHARHRQGGSSSQRFARHREKQMEYLFERVCAHVRELLEPLGARLDHIIYGGEEHTLRAFRKQCPFLDRFEDRVLPWRLDIRKPRQTALEAAISEVWSSEVIEWSDSG